MTFKVLAVDGLDVHRADGYPWLSSELEDYRAIEVPVTRYYEEPVTPVVWASFLTGQDPEEHGVEYYGTWGLRPLDRVYWWLPTKIRYPYATNALKWVFSKVNEQYMHGMLPNVGDGILGETWLHEYGFDFVDFPHVNASAYFERERELYREFFETQAGIEIFVDWLRRDFDGKLDAVAAPSRAAVYYRHLDTLGHLMVSEARYDRWYRRFARLVQTLAPRDEILIVSDHGTTLEGHHTQEAYCGATFPLPGVNSIQDLARVVPQHIHPLDHDAP